MILGMKVRKPDLTDMLKFNPKILEFHFSDSDLNLEEVSVGLFNQSQVYHIEKINDNFWFAITNYVDVNEVHVLSSDGIELDVYNVGRNPGDFAFWSYSD